MQLLTGRRLFDQFPSFVFGVVIRIRNEINAVN